jgi:hypothetical protein
MFIEALKELFNQHRERILQVCDAETTKNAFDELYRADLDCKSIDEAICEELKVVLKKTHDFQISDRLNKYGWTTTHINDHMLRFFEKKMKSAANVLSQYIKNESKNVHKEMLSSLNDIHESDSETDDKYAAIHRIIKQSSKESSPLTS